MTVKELIEKLQEFDPESKVVTITIASRNEWEYTSEPKISTHKNMFGEKVFIQ